MNIDISNSSFVSAKVFVIFNVLYLLKDLEVSAILCISCSRIRKFIVTTKNNI